MNGIAIKKWFPLAPPSERILILAFAGILGSVLFVEVLQTSHPASAQAVPQKPSQPIVFLASVGNAASVPLKEKPALGPMLEIHVANNGLVLLRGARVISVDGSSIAVATGWGSTEFRWNIETGNYATVFVRRDGQKGNFADITAGDFVTITGKLDTSSSSPTLKADTVRY